MLLTSFVVPSASWPSNQDVPIPEPVPSPSALIPRYGVVLTSVGIGVTHCSSGIESAKANPEDELNIDPTMKRKAATLLRFNIRFPNSTKLDGALLRNQAKKSFA